MVNHRRVTNVQVNYNLFSNKNRQTAIQQDITYRIIHIPLPLAHTCMLYLHYNSSLQNFISHGFTFKQH